MKRSKRIRLAAGILCAVLLGLFSQAGAENRGDETLKKADEVIAAVIRPGMGEYEKALALHDWLLDHVQYELSSARSFHADAALLDGYGVCQSYAEAYGLLLGKAGLHSMLAETSFHAWNLVRLDGDWYHVDATWDNGGDRHRFFAVPDLAIGSVEHHAYAGYCCAYRNNYAYRNGVLDGLIQTCRDAIQARIDEGETHFTVDCSGWSVSGDRYSIMKKTALAAVCDLTFRVQGSDRTIRISVHEEDNEEDPGCSLEIDTEQEPEEKPASPEPREMQSLVAAIGYPTTRSVRIQIDGNAGSGGYVCIARITRKNGEVVYDNGRAQSSLKDIVTLYTGEYTAWLYITDGRTESIREEDLDFTEYTPVVIPHDESVPHTLMKIDQADAGCTADGTEAYWICYDCKEMFSDAEAAHPIGEPVPIPAKGHVLTEHPETAPTCTEDGNEAYWSCEACGMLFSDAEALNPLEAAPILPAAGHQWTDPAYEWAEDLSSVTASRTCPADAFTETESAPVYPHVTRPTASADGLCVYASTGFENQAFHMQTRSVTIPALKAMHTLYLPDSLRTIEEQAFEGAACEAVLIPDTCVSVGKYALRDCPDLMYVRIPEATAMDPEAFAGCGNVIIDIVKQPAAGTETDFTESPAVIPGG